MLSRTAIPSLLVTLSLAACDDWSGPGGNPRGIIDDGGTPDGWRTVAAGTYNSCALGADSSPYCWGFALVSQCDDGGCAVDAIPTRVEGTPAAFDTVASGGGFHCGITVDRSAYCWGESPGGSLGDGTSDRSAIPVRVAIDAPVKALATGYGSACALTEDGEAWCWGWKIGWSPDEPVTERLWMLPRPVDTPLRFSSITLGGAACGIATDGAAYCWGGGYGRLGVGDRDFDCEFSESCFRSSVPVPIESDRRWTSISSGTVVTCGVTTDHLGFCWGAIKNYDDPWPPYGLLGSGSFSGSKSPVPVAGDLEFRQIVAGTRHVCGITMEGKAYCWGDNELAQLGVGSHGGRSAVPLPVVGELQFSSLALADHSCGLTSRGNIYCWGVTYGGLLGIGVSGPGVRTVPTRLARPREDG
jgi:alpha-tubulin suppressor-like RCC1 family protein